MFEYKDRLLLFKWYIVLNECLFSQNLDYYSKIKQPIALSTIKQKLEDGHPGAYNSVSAFIKDVKLMFSNAYLYNDVSCG